MGELRRGFEAGGDGLECTRARRRLVDEIVLRLWAAETAVDPQLAKGVALFAVGGYGHGNLYPYSDVDLLFVADKSQASRAKDPIRRVSQGLWDCGMEAALTTRQPGECEKFEATNPEFTLAMLDLRSIGGDPAMIERVEQKNGGRRWQKEAKPIGAELMRLTRERHAKYGNTLFHLEPNIKDCPGGLRDANVCHWLAKMRTGEAAGGLESDELMEGVRFLAAVRCFLHYRHGRDDNTLDWRAQDAAAGAGIGLELQGRAVDTAYWMRAYFRHARLIERRLEREIEGSGLRLGEKPVRRPKPKVGGGLAVVNGKIELEKEKGGVDPVREPEIVLAAFAAMAESGMGLTSASEERISEAIPHLSMALEEGPGLWRRLSAILVGRYAGSTLRSMHALGVLELILPEFHGIDALVIRDAYHRYTVDEHTFVLIDTLHGLNDEPGPDAPDWRVKLGQMVRELHQPALLYLAALMHDTGKGRVGDHHAVESARMAEGVLRRLEMDSYDAGLVLRLIAVHLDMSAALRRDIFDAETVRTFAAKVQTQELLRMLTLFTYADIAAVHPDALTPWKAENLWRLEMRTANQLDRNVDEERVHAGWASWRGGDERVAAVLDMAGADRNAVEAYLEGFPERYLQTRTPAEVLRHFGHTQRFEEQALPLEFHHGDPVSEITLVTRDRPRLFAGVAAALAAWGMNVVTADAFANAAGVVVDSFRFTDTFRTLELNPAERERFVESVRRLIDDPAAREAMLRGRSRGRRAAPRRLIETAVEFHDVSAAHSTLMQVIAQDVPGLLRAISQTLSELAYNVEVALIDTEGEMAIDVFYLSHGGAALSEDEKRTLREAMSAAIAGNAEGTA
jgi:[protein-PII] uridylyltransferase